MEQFTRTFSGKISRFLFFDEVVVWVEGRTDIPFYRCLIKNRRYRLEITDGKQEIIKLAKELIKNNYPFVVILDGDYDILQNRRSPHRRVVVLQRYSIENYLFEKESIKKICSLYSNSHELSCSIDEGFAYLINQINENLRDLLIFDIAKTRLNREESIFPDGHECLMESRTPLIFSTERIENRCNLISGYVDQNLHNEIISDIEKYTQGGRFVDLIKGHFLFGLFRDFIISTLVHENHHRPTIDNDSLLAMISEVIWNKIPSSDHKNLRRRIVNAIKDAATIKNRLNFNSID
jgi:hypothetical protein